MALGEYLYVIAKVQRGGQLIGRQISEILLRLHTGHYHIKDRIYLEQKQKYRHSKFHYLKYQLFSIHLFFHASSPSVVNRLNKNPISRQIITIMIATLLPYPYF